MRLGFLLSAEESKESEAGIALDLLPLAHCRLITGGQNLFPANLRHKSLKKKVKKNSSTYKNSIRFIESNIS